MTKGFTTREKKLAILLANPRELSANDIARTLNDLIPEDGHGTRSGAGVREIIAKEAGRRYVPPGIMDGRKIRGMKKND